MQYRIFLSGKIDQFKTSFGLRKNNFVGMLLIIADGLFSGGIGRDDVAKLENELQKLNKD